MKLKHRAKSSATFIEVFFVVFVAFQVGCSPLNRPAPSIHNAIYKRDTRKVQQIIKKGKDINVRCDNKKHNGRFKTPLYYAAETGQEEIVVSLLNAGADVHLDETFFGNTPLHAAAYNGYATIAAIILKHGANTEDRNNTGNTPLHTAASKGHAILIKLLLEEGADINAKNNQGETPLNYSVLNNNIETTNLLIELGANVNITYKYGMTLLMKAAGTDSEMVKYLIEKGADVNSRSDEGLSPLMIAAREGKLNAVKYLIDNGAGINAEHVRLEFTAIHFAASNDNVDIIDYLILSGAKVEPTSDVAIGHYSTAVSSVRFAKYNEDHGKKQNAISYYRMAGEYYEKASVSYKKSEVAVGDKLTDERFRIVIGILFTGVHVDSLDTSHLSEAKKKFRDKLKECQKLAKACYTIADYYQGTLSDQKAEKRIKAAKECLGLKSFAH